MKILLAGVTGQLGHGVVELAASRGVTVVPVVRGIQRLDGPGRVARTFRDRTDLAGAALTGDVTAPLWGLRDDDLDRIAGEIDAVVNVAAETNFGAPRHRLHAVNVAGGLHGLEVARQLHARHPRCAAYIHASSVFVAGGRTGNIPEAPLPPGPDRTEYEHTKWLAEHYLLERAREADGVAVGIARIGGLLGDSRTGRTAKRNSLYRLVDSSLLPWRLLPAPVRGRVDMLPRDEAARMLLDVTGGVLRLSSPEPQIVHVCAGEDAPTLREVLKALDRLDPLGTVRRPRALPVPPRWIFRLSTDVPRALNLSMPKANMVVGMRYFALDRVFARSRLARFARSPLPCPSAETIARLAFRLPHDRVDVRRPDQPLARYE